MTLLREARENIPMRLVGYCSMTNRFRLFYGLSAMATCAGGCNGCLNKQIDAVCCQSLRDRFGHPAAQVFCSVFEIPARCSNRDTAAEGRSSHQSDGLPNAKWLRKTLRGSFPTKNFHDDWIENLNDRNSRCHLEPNHLKRTEVISRKNLTNTPRWARTSNLRFRRPMLYPIELGVPGPKV